MRRYKLAGLTGPGPGLTGPGPFVGSLVVWGPGPGPVGLRPFF